MSLFRRLRCRFFGHTWTIHLSGQPIYHQVCRKCGYHESLIDYRVARIMGLNSRVLPTTITIVHRRRK